MVRGLQSKMQTINILCNTLRVRPEVRSKPGHEDSGSVIANVTPLEKRAGNAQNWQIIHSAEVVQKALAEGRFATLDGYIFDQDVLCKETFLWEDKSFSIQEREVVH